MPAKGTDKFAIKRLKKDIELLGYKRIIIKSDNESSILALKQAVKEIPERKHHQMQEKELLDNFEETTKDLNPATRMTPREALEHDFLRKVPPPTAAGSARGGGRGGTTRSEAQRMDVDAGAGDAGGAGWNPSRASNSSGRASI